MADIDITCVHCSKVVTVSEFVDRDSLSCPFCRKKATQTGREDGSDDAAQPKVEPPAAGQSRLKIRKTQGAIQAPETDRPAHPDEQPDAWRFNEMTQPMDVAKERVPIRHHIFSWLLFLVVGGAMWVVRYSGRVPSQYVADMNVFGPYIVLGFYILIILKAFKDTVFQGILCVVIPLYPFFYLFVICDDFYLRAVFGALLIGIGQDSAIFFQGHVNTVIETVHAWIASGG
jgi:hypothetical protein